MCSSVISAFQCKKISTSAQQMDLNEDKVFQASSKIRALVRHLRGIELEDSSVKSVVFSQFTSMLSLIETGLQQAGIKFVRLDGSMSQGQRTQAIQRFNDDSSIKVFLISTKAGGQGLNLARASRAFLIDPWWNGSAEEQAIDRVHRIGQERDVFVHRFIMRDSIEEKILALQQKKFQLANKALDKNDLKEIFSL